MWWENTRVYCDMCVLFIVFRHVTTIITQPLCSFHGFGHKCSRCFKANSIHLFRDHNTSICEQFNSFIRCLSRCTANMSLSHLMFLVMVSTAHIEQFNLCQLSIPGPCQDVEREERCSRSTRTQQADCFGGCST